MTDKVTLERDPDVSAKPSMARLARGTSANLLGAAAMASTNILLTVLVTHALSRDDAGVFFSSTSVFLVATTLGMLGTNTGLVYFVARCRALGQLPAIFAYFRAGLTPVVVVGCGMAAVMFAFAGTLAGWITDDQHAEQMTLYLRILSLLIPFAGIENVTLAAIRGLGSMKATVLVEQVGRSLVQIVLVGVALLTPTTAGLAATWAFPYLPAAVVALWWWRRQSTRLLAAQGPPSPPAAGGAAAAHEPAPSVRGQFWRFTGPRALASVGQLLIQRLDIILVAALAGAAQAAIYTAATRFLVVGQMGNRAISTAVQPRLAETLARGDRNATNFLYQSSTAWLMILSWPLYLTFAVFSSTFLRIFPKGYATGTTVVVLLSCAMLFATLCGMVDMVLNMGGRTSWNLGNVVVALCVNIGLDLWLIPNHGFLGAAIGWAVAIVLQNALAISQTGYALRVHPFGRAGRYAAALTVACFGFGGALWRLALGPTWLAVAATLVTGGGLYVAALWQLRATLQLDALRALRRKPIVAATGGM